MLYINDSFKKRLKFLKFQLFYINYEYKLFSTFKKLTYTIYIYIHKLLINVLNVTITLIELNW